MFKVDDKVYLDETDDEGTIKEIHPHEAIASVKVPGGQEDRKNMLMRVFASIPTMKEESDFIDH